MSWYFYWQADAESAWKVALSDQRERIVSEEQPPFTTILDLDADVKDSFTSEQHAAIRYRGPLYFDFDSSDLEEVIPAFKRFLGRLEKQGVDLDQVELYATGGRGFHVIVPQAIFINRPNSAGYQHLPVIYREMAASAALYVDTLDLRVYSARRGRMFRTTDIKRTNGKYKVQLTTQEARNITAEHYEAVTSVPRGRIPVRPPTLAQDLSLLFSTSRDSVTKKLKARSNSKKDKLLVEKWNGDFPPTLQLVMRGEGVRPDTGFQSIATQIAITCHALGKSEKEMIEACQGLIENHASDGIRYNTPEKRRKELRRMWEYMQGNPCYEFSANALRTLVKRDVRTPDLELINDPSGALSGDDGEDDDDDLGLNEEYVHGVFTNKRGIFRKVYDKESQTTEIKLCCAAGISTVTALADQDGKITGYECQAHHLDGDGNPRITPVVIDKADFRSRVALQAAFGDPTHTSINMSELQTQALMSILGAKARKTGGTLRTVPREGVDVVTLPDGEHEVIYAGLGPKGVISLKGNKYQLRVPYGSEDGEIHSDLALAPLIEDTRETREFLDTFLTLQQKSVTARVIGFYLASFMCQLIRQTHNQFPLLQVYGEAGTGKTSFNSLCSSLHYYRRQPVVFSAAGITNYSLESLISSSASIPLLFDEFKPSEMDQRKAKNFLLTIRNNYNASVGGKGRLTKEAGRSGVIVARVSNAAPIVFLSEQRETQTAIVDRAISVPMDIKRAAKDAEGYNYCLARRSILGQWGHLCMQIALTLDIEELREAINQNIQVLQKSLGDAVASARPVFNNAVILTALEFGKGSLEKVFGDRYARIFDEFRDEVTGNIATSIPSNLSEPSKVISDLAHLSGRRSDDPFALELGLDYAPALDGAGEECVELHLKNCWDKYARFRRSQGATPLFDTEMSFIDAMLRHPAVVDRVCVTSPLKGARATVKVVRFSLRKLYAEPSLEEFAKLN